MSDNFVNKNIRVRPTSAYVANEETSSRMSHGSPHRDDEHFKFDQMVNIEMEEQRNLIKEKLKDKVGRGVSVRTKKHCGRRKPRRRTRRNEEDIKILI